MGTRRRAVRGDTGGGQPDARRSRASRAGTRSRGDGVDETLTKEATVEQSVVTPPVGQRKSDKRVATTPGVAICPEARQVGGPFAPVLSLRCARAPTLRRLHARRRRDYRARRAHADSEVRRRTPGAAADLRSARTAEDARGFVRVDEQLDVVRRLGRLRHDRADLGPDVAILQRFSGEFDDRGCGPRPCPLTRFALSRNLR
jgi:hypothetical protein